MDGKTVEILLDVFPVENDEVLQQGMDLMNKVIEEGRSWPFDEAFSTMESYCGYFHSHASFWVHFGDNEKSSNSEILGCFYAKPNFPGRCSHVCNGGFITNPRYRGLGIGKFMGEAFKQIGRDLGFKSSLFNLVFANNMASVSLWRNLGYTQLACIPKAANLKGCSELVDAYQFYYDFTKTENESSSPAS